MHPWDQVAPPPPYLLHTSSIPPPYLLHTSSIPHAVHTLLPE
jgi:hypothetical protein